PIRIVLDRNLSLPPDLYLFDGTQPTIVYHQNETVNVVERPNVAYAAAQSLHRVLQDLHQRSIQSVLVEGGTTLLKSFLDAGLWDEMRVFRSQAMLGKGVKAPTVQGDLVSREMIGNDELTIYKNSPGK
ncbi:RibD family protein, partial [Spirosoma sp.]|uniref:RibD family protein n=1 Tax=Spirosoma sp. TaxID=1899569 RepID=UPI003B3B67C8